MQARRNTSVRYPGGRKAAAGFLAHLGGYLLFYGILRSTASSFLGAVPVTRSNGPATTLALFSEGGGSSLWHLAGVAWYNAHLVPAALLEPRTAAISPYPLFDAGGWYPILFLVPPVLLVGAGGLVVYRVDSSENLRFDLGDTTRRRYAMNGGLTVLLGYLPLALLGGFLFSASGSPPHLTIEPLAGWLFVGFLYPFVFGAIGGRVGYYVNR